MRRIKSNKKRMEGSNGKWKDGRYFALNPLSVSRLKFEMFFFIYFKGFFHLIWPFHPFSIGFDSLSISIPRMIPIGNECKVQNSFKYRLELIFSFGVPHLHLYIYNIYRWRCGTPNDKIIMRGKIWNHESKMLFIIKL